MLCKVGPNWYKKNNSMIHVQPLIIAVEENETVLEDTPDKLGIEAVCIISFPYLFLSNGRMFCGRRD